MAIEHSVTYQDDLDLGVVHMIQGPDVDIQFQHGLIPENGVNGVTNEALLDLLAMRIRAQNSGEYKCRENSLAITKIEEARLWLNERTRVREAQGVEGKHAPHEEPIGS